MKIIIVPVSGGKDSQVVLGLALEKYDKSQIVCVHQNTGYDHPDTYLTIEKISQFYGVEIQHTRNKFGGMFGFLEQAKYFPNSAARGCTQRLKQEPFAAWLRANKFTPENCEIWFGMRSDESANRAAKYGELKPDDVFTLGDVSTFYNNAKNRPLGLIPCLLPIVDWNTQAVFDYIEKSGAPLNPLYAKGHVRVGCYPCLLARKSEWQSAGNDMYGRQNILHLIEFEDKWRDEGNPRKFIKVHRKWDVRLFISGESASLEPETESECGYCSI